MLIDEIIRHQPYSTGPSPTEGDHLIREVAQMANGKHTISIGAVAVIPEMTIDSGVLHAGGGMASFGSPWDPVKKEMIIAKIIGDATASYTNPRIARYITFDYPGPVGEVPADVVAMKFAEKAQIVLDGFKAICAP